ncbi:hypothetical protein [Lactobacillus intestinalis]|uniref:hypothetical protein n=1 Tax=Lactobacillus intestinalis TaxID=151781 RepID=UPI001F57A56F|nr:hypothetical protein [Lactobacillus intestinalis]
MKKSFKFGLIAAGMLAIAPIGLSVVNTSVPVQAAQKIYGKGKKYTIPSSYHGTWYANKSNVKSVVTIGAHSFNGKTAYHQNKKAIPDRIYNPSTKAQFREQKRVMNATKNIWGAYYTKRSDGNYLTFAPWIGFEEWYMFKPKTMKVNGKTVKYLAYSSGYVNAKYFKTRSLAKKY